MDLFFVASRGLTATTWFSQALNKHPNIFCCHGRDRPERGIETAKLLSQREYREDRLAFEQKQRQMSLSQYLQVVKNASSGQEILGNVHGFVLVELIDKLTEAKRYGDMPIANMVRNPIMFLESYSALVCHIKIDYPEKFYNEFMPRAKDNQKVLKRYGVTDLEDVEMSGFVEGCQALVKTGFEIDIDNVPTIIMEKIVSDKKYFAKTAEYLTRGKCCFDDAILEDIFSQGKINAHRDKCRQLNSNLKRSNLSDKPYILWKNWTESKRRIFHHFLEEKQINKFISLGYDLSFVKSA